MSEQNLLPCPCCGNNATMETDIIGSMVICCKCDIGFVHENWTKEYCIKTWNTRTESKVLSVEELEKQMEDWFDIVTIGNLPDVGCGNESTYWPSLAKYIKAAMEAKNE